MTVELGEATANTPLNLREQVGERALIAWALEAVEAVAERLPRWCGYTDGSSNPRMLLTLLTYSYAMGTYGSEDVELSCRREAGARYISANMCPDQDIIRHFRRANLPWVEECLARVYAKALGLNPAELGWAEAVPPDNATSWSARLRDCARRTVERAILFDVAMNDY